MDPLELTDAGKKPKFMKPILPSARKLQVEYFSRAGHYQEWIEKNPYIEIINVIDNNDWIVLTYKEAI